MWPHKYIFNRVHFEQTAELMDFKAKFGQLSHTDRAELLWLLSTSEPRNFKDLPKATKSAQLRELLGFYVPLPKEEEVAIWKRSKQLFVKVRLEVPDDERVEDAGLADDDSPELSFSSEETDAVNAQPRI
jgi:hypothetical protein